MKTSLPPKAATPASHLAGSPGSHGGIGQADPAVQLAHRRIDRSDRRENDLHSLHVVHILLGKDRAGITAKFHPKAKEDAEALASYTPATGHVAVGMKPGRPTEEQARAVGKIHRKRAAGKDLTEDELHALADRDVSHVRVKDGWDDSDIQGHRFLVHNRLDGTNWIHSEADLKSMSEPQKDRHRGTPEVPSRLVPLRQFDSQGVEVPLEMIRYERAIHPIYAIRRKESYSQDKRELRPERERGKSVRRAKFGTSEPKS